MNRFNQMGGNELGIAGEDKRFIRAEFVGALLTVILVVSQYSVKVLIGLLIN